MAPTRGIQPLSPLSDSMSLAQVILQSGVGSLKSSAMERLKALKKATGERNLTVVSTCLWHACSQSSHMR